MGTSDRETVRKLLAAHGRTYADQAGIQLRNTPQPLYQLLVLSGLLSARIRSDTAVAASRALSEAGLRDARRMADATWQQRVDALGRGGYRRYDERTSTQLGAGAELLLDKYHGDLRRLRDTADGDTGTLRSLLREVPGLGPVGVDIFLREVQGVWPEVAPYLDEKTLQGARRRGLPDEPQELARLADHTDPAVFAAAMVRAALERTGTGTTGSGTTKRATRRTGRTKATR
ncbi:endonuclease [Streptomyces lushanensis]|uniref:endonuclease n=1 Tax=Streptomyces lushanensis TaxID=1434255 RepID=UPI000ADF416F|nr:endonuclease [Streptomyces lushanensis]